MPKITTSHAPSYMPLSLYRSKASAQNFLLSNIHSVENTTFYRADTRPPEVIARSGFAGSANAIPGEIRLFGNRTVFASSTFEDCRKFIAMIDHENIPGEYHFYKLYIKKGESFNFDSIMDKAILINALATLTKEEFVMADSEAMLYAHFAVEEYYPKVKVVQVKGPVDAENIHYLGSATYGK
ncbi:hypothetical protein [Vagococcus sp. WN89Y]|uniref:hypothetical protein n=1 Tax=Vagococcus sp. WN89Y TaxID=3457258 RepID=UPI003FCD95F1